MILGVLLHFSYNLSGDNLFVASFSAVNESTWEHLKLVFFPFFLNTIIGLIFYKKSIPNFICAKLKGLLFAICFIVIFFYTYTGILGTNIAILDISFFFVSVILGEFLTYQYIIKKHKSNKFFSAFLFLLLLVFFISFTFYPPKINLFKDPVSNSYGINNTI